MAHGAATTVRLLAGSVGDEREPPRRVSGEPDWHVPLHVRRAADARTGLAEQIAAGADVITAPTYRTSRSALSPYGEARRAGEWTADAARVAREAVEEGSDRRPAVPEGVERPPVLVCGPLTPPTDGDDAHTDDYRPHAETMAEAGVDVLLVEFMPNTTAARVATMAAAGTGLPVWTGARLAGGGTFLASGEQLGEWLEAVAPAEPERLVLYGADGSWLLAAVDELSRLTDTPVGACWLDTPTMGPPDRLLEPGETLVARGATLLGIASRAGPAALGALRTAIDAQLAIDARAEAESREHLRSWIDEAAARAPSGRAVWIGDPPAIELTHGFAWTIVPASAVGQLPEDHYRLVIVNPTAADAGRVARRVPVLLEHGGVMLAPLAVVPTVENQLRLLELVEERGLAILRRG